MPTIAERRAEFSTLLTQPIPEDVTVSETNSVGGQRYSLSSTSPTRQTSTQAPAPAKMYCSTSTAADSSSDQRG